ncbi:hypothetical protein D3C75_1101520 [compost metagenome]
MFTQKVGTGVHQCHGIQRAAAEMRRVGRVGGDALEAERGLNIGQAAGIEHAAEAFRVPGEGGIHIGEQPFTHHKGFTRAAFFPWAAVKAYRAG